MKLLILLTLLLQLRAAQANPTLQGYTTSNLSSLNELTEAFNLTHKNGAGECFQRAHYWSYQLYKERGLNTEKFYIFFSARYKRLINSQWWFHVAPGLNMQGRPYVFDNEFLKRPVAMEAWKNGAIDHGIRYLTQMKKQFNAERAEFQRELRNGRVSNRRRNYITNRLNYIDFQEKKYLISGKKIVPATPLNWPYDDNQKEIIDLKCLEIDNYSDYKKYGEQYHCFIYRTSMYYFEPIDMENLEKSGRARNQWNRSEVFTAFRKSFGGRFPY